MTESNILVSPGYYGLNKEKALSVLAAQWATVTWNCVIDDSGRLASRKGWVNQTTSAISGTPSLYGLHEYVKSDGTTSLIAAGGNKLYDSSDSGATWTDRTGAVVVSGDNWQFANFNSKVLAAQSAHVLVVKTSGNFAAVAASSGSVPTNPVAVIGAFGRVWCVGSDLQTIYYSALLDETKWAVADGGGLMDIRTVWTQGMDTIVAIAAFAGRLVIFGKRHIIVYSDGRGSPLGLDPNNVYVEDVIEGTGTSARDSVQAIGEGDLLFLGSIGVQSFKRVLQDKQTPIGDVTKNSRKYVNAIVNNAGVDKTQVRSVYSPEEGFYLLMVPSFGTLCVDVRVQLEDGTYRLFDWPLFGAKSGVRRVNGDLLFGLSGVVGKYSGYTDNSSAYTMSFMTGYVDMAQENTIFKELKSLKFIAATAGNYTATAKWWWDFGLAYYTASLAYVGALSSEYGSAQYGLSEYGSTTLQRLDSIPGAGAGQFLRIGIDVVINGAAFNLHAIQLITVPGRIA